MNHEDIFEMAREAGYISAQFTAPSTLERFAALVAAAEREACAKVCDDMVLYTGYDCAEVIRARGNT